MVRNHDCLPPPMPERTHLAPRRRGSGHPPISNLGLCLRTLAVGHELATFPDGSVPDGDQLFLVEYPLAFACLRYFNAFEWGMLQVASRRSDTPAEERSADGECVSLLTMSKRMNDPSDFVIGNVSKFLGAKLRLQIFLQEPFVIVWVRSFLLFNASW